MKLKDLKPGDKVIIVESILGDNGGDIDHVEDYGVKKALITDILPPPVNIRNVTNRRFANDVFDTYNPDLRQCYTILLKDGFGRKFEMFISYDELLKTSTILTNVLHRKAVGGNAIGIVNTLYLCCDPSDLKIVRRVIEDDETMVFQEISVENLNDLIDDFKKDYEVYQIYQQ